MEICIARNIGFFGVFFVVCNFYDYRRRKRKLTFAKGNVAIFHDRCLMAINKLVAFYI